MGTHLGTTTAPRGRNGVTKHSHNSRGWQCRDLLPNPGERRGHSRGSPLQPQISVFASISCPSSAAQTPSLVQRDTDSVPPELWWGKGGLWRGKGRRKTGKPGNSLLLDGNERLRGDIAGCHGDGGSAARQAQNNKLWLLIVQGDTEQLLRLILRGASSGTDPPGDPGRSHSRSIRNVSSVAGSVRTMSGSLSMCSPSKVKGSILSSSRGNWESVSKLTSPTPAKELVSSFDKLGGDSPVTAGNRTHRGCLDGENSSLKVLKQLPKTLGTFMELSDK